VHEGLEQWYFEIPEKLRDWFNDGS